MEDNTFAKITTYGELGIIALRSFCDMGKKIDEMLIRRHREHLQFYHGKEILPESYIIPHHEIRFSNGEGKVKISQTVRGKDIFILCDIGNYSCTYEMHGFHNHMSPDDHFQDIKRVLSAIGGKARRVTVIMPLLYASRQHKRKSRESLDCAMALQELQSMGVNDILSFDVHNSSVQNAIPLVSFENFYPTYDIVKAIVRDYRELLEKERLILISPDTGAMDRAIYYASLLKADVGLFYKRRDYTKIVKGSNPIVEHEYMGPSLEGKNVLIVDDMIASGDSVFDIVEQLRKRNTNKILVAATFAFFTGGLERFNEYYQMGSIEKVYSTNLSYIPQTLIEVPWFKEVDMSGFIAALIDNYNFGKSVAPLLEVANKTDFLK